MSREVGSIRLSKWGRVVAADGEVPWLLVDPDGVPVAPVTTFLLDFVAICLIQAAQAIDTLVMDQPLAAAIAEANGPFDHLIKPLTRQ
ncbi:hypothetical protein ILP97_43305 [Amycolatopsis sp. H6(2020)]|nr:hypothetical protein [Amycolatopsis sp. H6(2020)]